MSKVILVLSDALRYDAAVKGMGYLGHLVEDVYPDLELFATAGMLVRRFAPGYILVHSMGMDYYGETFGSDSSQYRNQAIKQDMWLAPLIDEWVELGYNILATGDHDINKDGIHGGPALEQREVPLYLIRPDREGSGDTGKTASHLQLASTILEMLEIPIPPTMKQAPIT